MSSLVFILDAGFTLASPKKYEKVKKKFVIKEIKQESLMRLVEKLPTYD